VIAVNEDIDPENADAILWAMSYRANPISTSTSCRIATKGMVHAANAMAGKTARCHRCDPQGELPADSLPKREFMERAKVIWEELGLPSSSRAPWFGHSLGEWSDEMDQAPSARPKEIISKSGELLKNAGARMSAMNTEVRTSSIEKTKPRKGRSRDPCRRHSTPAMSTLCRTTPLQNR